jgi:hypothetical protein
VRAQAASCNRLQQISFFNYDSSANKRTHMVLIARLWISVPALFIDRSCIG